MNPRKPDRFAFLEKRKTSGRDSLSIRVQAVKCNMQRLVLESHPFCFYGFHAMKLLKFTLYICVHACSLRWKPRISQRPLTSVQGQRALPFNNTCCSSERLDEDDYMLHSHDPILSCLMSRICLFCSICRR